MSATSGKQEFTPVALNQIHGEKIKKEMKHHRLNLNFHANPATLEIVTTKPNERPKRFLDKDQALLESIRKKNPSIVQNQELLQNETMKQLLEDEQREQESKQRNEAFREKLLETTRAPRERFSKPITSNHAYGWFSEPLYKSTRFYKPKNRSEETLFADHLVRLSTATEKKSK